MVSDLHALVGAAGIEEPFVIVGHSAGGLAARLYAATYPDDVSGWCSSTLWARVFATT